MTFQLNWERGKYIKFASDAWLVGKKNRSFEIDAFIWKYSIYSG